MISYSIVWQNLCLRSPSLDAITPFRVLTTSSLFFYLRIFFSTFCACLAANQNFTGESVGPLTVGKRRFRCRVFGIDGVRDACPSIWSLLQPQPSWKRIYPSWRHRILRSFICFCNPGSSSVSHCLEVMPESLPDATC